jgi:transcriptional regulator with XRE-family HTH domain
MALRSPKDVGRDPDEVVEGTPHVAGVYWDPTADFGAWLRTVRERKGWTTREAAKHFGVSQAYVSKLENQERKQAPGEDVLRRIAGVYGVDLREVMHEAGIRFEIPPSLELNLQVDDAFLRLLSDPRFRPGGFEPDHHRYFSPVVKQQILDLALNVARAVQEEGIDLEAWLTEGGEA